jgi:hypothetical protein
MIVSIHQPNYLPWLGYFNKIANSDVFIFLDSVQYTTKSFINRNKIKTPRGVQWITLPCLSTGRYGQLINEVEIANSKCWDRIHWNMIKGNYAKTPYFQDYKYLFESIYQKEWDNLAELNETLVKLICEILNIKNVKFLRASELNISGKSTEMLINICKAVGGDTYLSGNGGKNYMDEQLFEKEGIKLKYSEFQHPVYNQLWGDFVPNLSVIDFIFNEGGSNFLNIKDNNNEKRS